MIIQKAGPDSFERVRSFYHSLIDECKARGIMNLWIKDIYPSPGFLREAIRDGELYLGMESGAAMNKAGQGIPVAEERVMESGSLVRGKEHAPAAGDLEIAAAMVLNHSCNEGYKGQPWKVCAAENEVLVIHALGVHPKFAGTGKGREMTRKALEIAREDGMKSVRLDVLADNPQAKHIYVSCGFEYISTVKLFYENTGLTGFELYEHTLACKNLTAAGEVPMDLRCCVPAGGRSDICAPLT